MKGGTPKSSFMFSPYFRIMFPFIVILTVCSSNIYLHLVLHNFPIEIRELCEMLGIKCAYILLAGKWLNCSVCDILGGSLFPHADEKNSVNFFVWVFMGIVWPDVCARCSCIRKSIFYCAIYYVGVGQYC